MTQVQQGARQEGEIEVAPTDSHDGDPCSCACGHCVQRCMWTLRAAVHVDTACSGACGHCVQLAGRHAKQAGSLVR